MAVSIPAVFGCSGSTSYANDSSSELTQEQSTRLGGYTNSFVYDSAENPTMLRGASFSFNADNQNTADTLDGNGIPATYRGSTLSFDPEGRLTGYGSAITAGYRADGLRAWKANSSGTAYFLYDGIVPVCEISSAGSVTAVNTFGADGLLARRTTSSEFYAFDPQGSAAERLDSSDNILGSYAFDAFGARASTDSSTDLYSGLGGRWVYYADWETGAELLGHR